MKIMFLASNPAHEAPLAIDRELTELQRRFGSGQVEPVEFYVAPGLFAEDIPSEMAKFLPDILHISAHGERDYLKLASNSGGEVSISGAALKAFLPPTKKPRLLYINSCNSKNLAKQLIDVVPTAIGTTSEITNGAARSGALALYERLLSGADLSSSFEASRQMIEALSQKKTSSILFSSKNFEPKLEVFFHPIRLLLRIKQETKIRAGSEYIECSFLISGCPKSASQVVYFFDDQDWLSDDPNDWADECCIVSRGRSSESGRWEQDDELQEFDRDGNIFACITTAEGKCFSIASTIVRAITDFYEFEKRKIPKNVKAWLSRMRY